MKSQTSKAALKSLDRTEFLVMSMRTHQPNVSARLTEAFERIGGAGAPAPDWDLVQESHAALLEASATEVRRTDQVYRLTRVKLSEMRRDRRELVGKLKTRHRDLRKSFNGTYGEDALPFVGLDAAPERRFVAFREQQLEVLERMRDPELAARLPAPRAGQAAPDLLALADAIQAEILELEAAMAAIKGMRKQVDESLVVKRETLREHRRLYVNVARILEGYYRTAGLDELAERVRSPAQPRRRRTDETAEPTDDSQEPPAGSEVPAATPSLAGTSSADAA